MIFKYFLIYYLNISHIRKYLSYIATILYSKSELYMYYKCIKMYYTYFGLKKIKSYIKN